MINNDWMDYYQVLEDIRKSGMVNMFGASPYLSKICRISEKLSKQVLVSWMENYTELSKKFNWR